MLTVPFRAVINRSNVRRFPTLSDPTDPRYATPRHVALSVTYLLGLQGLADVGKRGAVGSILVVAERHPPLRRHRFARESLHVRKLAQKEPAPNQHQEINQELNH